VLVISWYDGGNRQRPRGQSARTSDGSRQVQPRLPRWWLWLPIPAGAAV